MLPLLPFIDPLILLLAPPVLCCILQDMAQVLTNDKFFASNHRVLQSSGRDRYSRAFFFNPSHSADIQPLQIEAVGGEATRMESLLGSQVLPISQASFGMITEQEPCRQLAFKHCCC